MKLNRVISLACACAVAVGAISFSASAIFSKAGDCYEDTVIDSKDILYLRKSLVDFDMTDATNFNADNCDYDQDGFITVKDLYALKLYLSKASATTVTTVTTTEKEWSEPY